MVTLVSLEDLQENERFHSDMHAYELKLDSGEKLTVEDLSVEDLKVWGCAYYIPPEFADEVKRYLDVREQDGYTLHKVPFYATSNDYEGSDEQYLDILSSLAKTESGETYCESSIYIGTIDNESFIGPEELLDTAKVIKYSRGPSGENSEYLINLCKSVRELEGEGRSKDTYLEELLASVEGNGLK